MEDENGKKKVPLYWRALSVWLVVLVFAACFRGIGNALYLFAALLSDKIPGETVRRHVESLFVGPALPREMVFAGYKVVVSIAVIAGTIFFARQRWWSRRLLRIVLGIDVLSLFVLAVFYRTVEYLPHEVDTVRLHLLYVAFIQVPAIILLGHPELVQALTKHEEDQEEDKDRDKKS